MTDAASSLAATRTGVHMTLFGTAIQSTTSEYRLPAPTTATRGASIVSNSPCCLATCLV